MMKNMMKVAGALVLMTTFSGFAQEKSSTPMTPAQQMAKAKAMVMKDREAMMGQVKAMDQNLTSLAQSMKSPTADQAKQIAALQQSVADLKKQLAATPQYFDPPQGGGNPTQ